MWDEQKGQYKQTKTRRARQVGRSDTGEDETGRDELIFIPD
jgi:hypothetical protein